MKTKFQLLLCLLLFFSFLLNSCSNDDDAVPTVSDLVGTWELTSLIIESSFDFDGDGTATRDLFVETDCYEGDFIDIMEDGATRIVTGLTFISVNDDLQPTHQCL